MPDKPKTFPCGNCGHILGQRLHDTMISPAFEVQFKRKHNIVCPVCRRHTPFCVTGRAKHIDTCVEKT